MAATNNVTRMLDARKIAYSAHAVPEEKLSALEVAEILQVPAEQVFKTIVVERDGKGKSILAIVPATGEVNLKALAKAVGEKKVHVTTMQKAEALTGLRAGGISPLALINKGFQVVLDESALTQSEIYISGGQWGLQIAITAEHVIQLTNAHTAHIT